MDIVMIGYAGRSGACALASRYRQSLMEDLPPDLVSAAAMPTSSWTIPDGVDVVSRAKLDRGVLWGLWILSRKLQCGFDVTVWDIPVLQEDVEICEILREDLYQIPAEGGWLIACDKTKAALERLHAAKIPAAVIGRIVWKKVCSLHLGDSVRYLEGPERKDLMQG